MVHPTRVLERSQLDRPLCACITHRCWIAAYTQVEGTIRGNRGRQHVARSCRHAGRCTKRRSSHKRRPETHAKTTPAPVAHVASGNNTDCRLDYACLRSNTPRRYVHGAYTVCNAGSRGVSGLTVRPSSSRGLLCGRWPVGESGDAIEPERTSA